MRIQVNEGPLDRLVRIVIGVGLLAVAVTGGVTAPLIYAVLLLGVIGLVTGLTGFCPTYALIGITTCPEGRA